MAAGTAGVTTGWPGAKRGARSLIEDAQRWYVVYSKPNQEQKAQSHLQLRGIEAFLPQLLLPKYVDRQKRLVPLFPNYLFVHVCLPEQYHGVLWCPGVSRFVTADGVPAVLEDEIMTFLLRHGGSDGVLIARSDLQVGQEVEIIGGPFDGIVGIIRRPPNAKGRVKVLMELLNRQVVQLDVPVQLVKGGWVA